MTPTFPAPPPATVRVWLARLDRPPLPSDELAAALSPEEAAHAAGLPFADVRERWIIGRGLLRRVLADALHDESGDAFGESRDVRALALVKGANGRPELSPRRDVAEPDARSRLAFNLSHARDVLAIAIARPTAAQLAEHGAPFPLGVDVEVVREVLHVDAVARRVFDDDERAAIAAHDDHAGRMRTFFRLWTRKEACMKATGAGFALPPHTFHVDADAARQRVALPAHAFALAGARIVVHDLHVGDDAAGAVAVAGEGWTVEVRQLG